MIIDLHIHTKCSDGKLSPKEIIDEAVKNSVKVIAIADHDTVDGYNDELFEYASKNKIKLIKAVEISTKAQKVGIHVLGYNIDLNNDEFLNKLVQIRNSRHEYLHDVGKKLYELGYVLNIDKLDLIDSVTKAHIARDIISNPINERVLLQNFEHIPNMGEFIETIMNENCPAYVLKRTVSPKEASDIIRMAGGKVILAHPIAYEYEDNLKEDEILDVIREMNADGIEANYIYVDRNNVAHNDAKKWNDFAKENHLKVTIGSDFHLNDGVRPLIGLINYNIELEDNDAKELIKWILE